MEKPTSSPETVHLEVDEPCRRLDLWLRRRMPSLTRSRVRKAAARGWIRVDGHPAGAATPVRPGQRVAVRLWRPTPPAQDIAVLYEDDAIVVVDKPPGVHSVAVWGSDEPCVAGALVALRPVCAQVGKEGDGGLLHRLDAGTSGVLVAAKDPAAAAAFARLQRDHLVRKTYVALVRGAAAAPRRIASDFRGAGPRGSRVLVVPGDSYVTDVVSSVRGAQVSRVTAVITSGFRHQIRAHLAHVGHPIVGDDLYGGCAAAESSRLFLHAARLECPHPVTGAPLRIGSPVPPEFGQRESID